MRALKHAPPSLRPWRFVAGVAVVAATALWLGIVSWRRWPDIFIDFGRELYIPWRLTAGDILYRDVEHVSGPLAPYFNALVFKLAGVGFLHLAVVNMVLAALLAVLVHRLISSLSDRYAGFSATLAFVGIFAFGQYNGPEGNYNFIAPYSHDLTHGIILSFIAIWWFRRFEARPAPWTAAVLGLLAGTVLLTKMEAALASSAAIGTGIALWYSSERSASKPTVLACFTAAFAAVPAAAFAILASMMSADMAFDSMIAPYRIAIGQEMAQTPYYLVCSGFDDPCDNLVMMGLVGLGYLGILGLFMLLARSRRSLAERHPRLYGAMPFVPAAILGVSLSFLSLLELARALPLVLLFMLVAAVYRWRRRLDEEQVSLARIVYLLYAMFMLVKIVLFPRFHHYGFALAMPGFMAAVAFLVHAVPRMIGRRTSDRANLRRAAMSVVIVVVALFVREATANYAMKTEMFASGSDLIYSYRSSDDDKRCEVMRETLAEIDVLTRQHKSFLVLPHGVILNYMSRCESDTSHHTFLPTDFSMYSEEHILGEIKAEKPAYIVILGMDTSELGFRYFGRDYGEKTFVWVLENYEIVEINGPAPFMGKGFGSMILKRKD